MMHVFLMKIRNYLVSFKQFFVSSPLTVNALQQLKTHRSLIALDDDNRWQWESSGDNPQFLLSLGLPVPGWYMLEANIHHDQSSAALHLYLGNDKGAHKGSGVFLPLKNGQVTKRIFWMPLGVQSVRIVPIDCAGKFSIHHLRLVWLTPSFAHDRLAQRLSSMHFEWRGVDKRILLSDVKIKAKQANQDWRELAMSAYDATFERMVIQHNYAAWLSKQGGLEPSNISHRLRSLLIAPLISVVVPVFNPRIEWLRACLDSVLAQHYPHWQLCIADDASTDPEVSRVLVEYVEQDRRVHVATRQTNGHICAASNSALSLAEGAYVCLLDHDDLLTADALLVMAEAAGKHPMGKLFYSDEDKLDDVGNRVEPHFKPDWNPDLLLAQNYISHLGMYHTALVREVGGFREGYEGSQDHDLVLRVTGKLKPEQIVHVPKVLYHWRAGEGSTAKSSGEKHYTSEAGLNAVSDYLAVYYPDANATHGALPNTYHVDWPLPSPMPLVSLLVPTRDKVEILRPCVEAILSNTSYRLFELLILDNGSRCQETLDYLQDVQARDSRVRVLEWDEPFNYSAINNFGARHARGELIGLVNNDIEPINAEWLGEMVRQASRPEIGCVGAKLYFPNDTLQHAGIILGIGGVAGHAHKYMSRHAIGYFSRLHLPHNLSAVTAACLLVRKQVFEAVGGLNEQDLTIAFNDVDFCLKVRDAGYRNLWTPYAELYHHESVSRGAEDNPEKRERAAREATYMRQTWGDALDNDPAYNPNLTLVYEDFSLR